MVTMETSTIQLSRETKEKISSFGVKGESYDVILERIYALAVKEQLRQFRLSNKRFIPIEEAIKEIERKWPRSK